ncbi:MAG: hypothetical protein AB7F22_10385 [Reyranella sp.]|uniref:hypothetical protein n=1 Tax=Reyranella sp. TaxID=1929291 RepID=UPI003D0AAA59
MSGRAWTAWRWVYLDIGEVVSEDNDEATVAIIPHGEQSEAVGCLIAAAPDMAEALANIIAANDEFRRALPEGWESDPVNDACEAARAALAKATEGASA